MRKVTSEYLARPLVAGCRTAINPVCVEGHINEKCLIAGDFQVLLRHIWAEDEPGWALFQSHGSKQSLFIGHSVGSPSPPEMKCFSRWGSETSLIPVPVTSAEPDRCVRGAVSALIYICFKSSKKRVVFFFLMNLHCSLTSVCSRLVQMWIINCHHSES